MKIFVEKEDVQLLSDVFYDLIFLTKCNFSYFEIFFENNNECLAIMYAYADALNIFVSQNLDYKKVIKVEDSDLFKKMIRIKFSIICNEYEYNKVKNIFTKEEFHNIFKEFKVIMENEKTFIHISDEYFKTIVYALKSYIGITSKNKRAIINFYKNFMSFDFKSKEFNKLFDIYLSYLGKVRKKENRSKAKALLKSFLANVE